MNILSLKVRNFRSFEGVGEEVKISLRKGINFIVGENNVGKSSLFRALQIISGSIGPTGSDFYKGEAKIEQLLEIELELNNNELKDLISNITGNNILLRKPENLARFARDLGQKFFLTFSSTTGFSMKTGALMFKQQYAELIRDYETKSIVKYEVKAFLEDYFSETYQTMVSLMKKKTNLASSSTRLNLDGEPANFVRNLFQTQLKVFSEIRKRPAGSSLRVPESFDGEHVASILLSLKNGNKKEQKRYGMIKKEFLKLFPNLDLDVRWGQGNNALINLDKIQIDYDMPIENVGAGIGEMIILLTHLIQSRDMIFGLDLPEMQFHPHAQRLLLKVLEEHAKTTRF